MKELQYFIPRRGHSFLPNDRMFGTAKRHIQKNDKIITPIEYENLIAETNENFEIRQAKTEDIDKKMMANPLQETSALWIPMALPKDKKVTFAISKVSHFTLFKTTPGLVTTRESIDCLVSHDFQL
ncbi:hypothetical protein HHI36_019728 [Cryptolaemus montrouzieri]|uniref:Uncharacterized protein n=1 Tax=Cryptolaemus montrouzieri TaxID=559131 RepID=A0ABD2N8K9_9CUCU